MPTQVKTATRVYDDVIDFIAGGTTPESVIEFQLSDAAKGRLEELIYRYKNEGMTPEERKELDEFLVVEHIMRLAKAKAHHIIQARSSDKAIEQQLASKGES